MKIKSILLVLFVLFSSSLFSQENVKIDLSLSTNNSVPDSINEKIRIISEDLGVLNLFTETLIDGAVFNYPKNQNEEKSGVKIEFIITESLSNYYEKHSEVFSDLLMEYVNNFSLQELKDLVAFYQSDLGKKTLKMHNRTMTDLTQAKADFLVSKDEVYAEIFGKKAAKKMKK